MVADLIPITEYFIMKPLIMMLVMITGCTVMVKPYAGGEVECVGERRFCLEQAAKACKHGFTVGKEYTTIINGAQAWEFEQVRCN